MNQYYKLALSLGLVAMTVSCAKQEALDFQVEKPISFEAQEDIDAYQALKTYINKEADPNFILGAAVSLSDYNDKGVMYRLINSNFEEITAGYEMKHGAVVQADGSLALDNVKSFLQTAKGAGISVYGHTLMWHANQNAGYLNGLIAPFIVKSPVFDNSLNVGGLKNSTLSGWEHPRSGAGISIVDKQGMGANAKAIKLVSGAGSSSAEALQLLSPEITVIPGHKYEVICYIKSDIPGEGRIGFQGMENKSFTTNLSWKEVKFQVSEFSGNKVKLHFDLGTKPNVTYYIDVNSLYVYDTQGEPSVNNLMTNGDFESGGAWGGWGSGFSSGITADGMGVGNKGKALYVTNPSKKSNYWDVQSSVSFAEPLNNGETYNLSFWVKGTAEGVIRPELQSTNYASNGFGQVQVTKEWKLVNISTTTTAADRIRLIFSYGEFAGTVYIDDVSLTSASNSGGSSTVVDRSSDEKKMIISQALQTWISGMVDSTKTYVKAWDVVNEPMDDGRPSELKSGIGRTLKSDEFYWQDYLGKDYAVQAFQLARAHGNQDDKHFINDYNLEYSLEKCRGLINYVEYIESKGAKVDGIGTQMHISINSDKEKIVEMFRMLAATGKLVKVSEMDIGVGVKTAVATVEHYQAQAEMYKYVIQKYFELIPAAQRYGITIWSPLDSPQSSSWRPGEPIGLWTIEGMMRKPAYTGVADGLADK